MRLSRERLRRVCKWARYQVAHGNQQFDAIIDRVLKVIEREAARPQTLRGALTPVIRECALQWGVDEADMMSRRKFNRLAEARHAAWAIGIKLGFKPIDLGRAFGRDHSTVAHGLKMAEQKIATRPHFAERYANAIRALEMETP